ncbi:MAG: CBS domain-containing protein [Sphingomonadales bacterium]|nr:MAG: CBS domain-containing protein [Sphingomonadales bacterium]TNF04917.1 MAG: CBS domain-containing protein [Sphingomonadales bacterium]
MLVRDLMTAPVVSVRESAPIVDALQLMLESKVSGLPVINDDNRLVGIVTEGDFLRRFELGTQTRHNRLAELFSGTAKLAQEYVRNSGRRVGDVMTRKVFTIESHASLDELVDMMTRHHIKRVPVVETSRMVGMVSRSDFLRMLLRTLTEADQHTPAGDDAIRRAVLLELQRQPWIGTGSLHVSVKNGTVELLGSVLHDSQRQAARVSAENIPGVTAVIDKIGIIEPVSGTFIPPA